MGTLTVIARQILDIDPALKSTTVIGFLPNAEVTPLKTGHRIALRAKNSDLGVDPNFTVDFDESSLIIAATWRQMFNDINSAFEVFCDLDRLARKRMLVVPKTFNGIGNRRNGAHLSHTWSISMHQHIGLQMTQPVPRTLGREIIFRHSLRQPNAMIAGAPALWSG